MKIEKISTKLVKPHCPTPQNLKNYNISFTDNAQYPMNMAVVLFYERRPEDDAVLEESLARILVKFYPLAGRYIKNDHLVDCSDQGVEFVKAEAQDVELADLVAKAEFHQLKPLLPDQHFTTDEADDDPLLSIRVTHLVSGRLAVAVSVSHRVFDVASLGTFIAVWSNATNPDKTIELITPSFDVPLLLPLEDHNSGVNSKKFIIENDADLVVKRCLFNKEALTSLRSKISLQSNGKPVSRVRIVCAIIAKTLIGLERAKHGEDKDFFIFQPVNMRERTIPPLTAHSCGNFSFTTPSRRVHSSEVKDIGLQELVDLIADGVHKTIGDHAEILSPNTDGRDILKNNKEQWPEDLWNPKTNVIIFTDWSRFGFCIADFGWGKPVGTSIGLQGARRHATVLMSTKDGDGIEAWVHLNQSDVDYFDLDENIKFFAN